AARRSTPGCASHDLADATCRAGATAPRSRASTPTTASGRGSQGRASAPASSSPGSPKYRNDGRIGRASTTNGSTSWGTEKISTPPRSVPRSRCGRGPLRASTNAQAEFVVPRSMPIRKGDACCTGGGFPMCQVAMNIRAARNDSLHGVAAGLLSLPDVELELPLPPAVAFSAPELERADLGHAAFERHGDHGSFLAVDGQRHLERPELLELVAPVLDQRAGCIALADRGAQEPELGRPSDREAEFAAGDRCARPFFHSEGDDAEGFQGGGEAGHGRQRALDADVVAARRAALDPPAAAGRARPAVRGGAAGDRVIEIRGVEDVRRVERR